MSSKKGKRNKTILFSAVGTTDPISKNHDGSILHIVRHYHPDEVHLYYSCEMYKYEQKDHRMEQSLELLMQKMGFHFTVQDIYETDRDDVQEFDYYLKRFQEILAELYRNNQKARILVNVSSGTPAMKSALQSLAVFSAFPITPIQVTTPIKKANHMRDDIDAVQMFEEDHDNESDAPDRTSESRTTNLLKVTYRGIIKELIDAYDYRPAIKIAKKIEDDDFKKAAQMICIAADRLDLIRPLPTGDEEEQFSGVFEQKDMSREYLLYLDILVKQKRYIDFGRAISPMLSELMKRTLEQECDFDFSKYTYQTTINSSDGQSIDQPKVIVHWNVGAQNEIQEDFNITLFDSINNRNWKLYDKGFVRDGDLAALILNMHETLGKVDQTSVASQSFFILNDAKYRRPPSPVLCRGWTPGSNRDLFPSIRQRGTTSPGSTSGL